MQKANLGRAAVLAMVTSALTFSYAASGADIGFVAGLTGGALDKPFDLGWSARLTSQGHTVTLFDQTTAASDLTLATMDLLIVSQDVGAGTFRSGVGVNQPMPMLLYEPALYSDFFGAGNGSVGGLIASGISIQDPSHPLAAGLSGTVSIYNGDPTISTFTAAQVSSGTDIIALSLSNPVQGVFAVLDAGQPGKDGNTWSASRVAVPCHDSWDPALVTADGWKLLDGAVAHTIPEPSIIALLGLGAAFIVARRQCR